MKFSDCLRFGGPLSFAVGRPGAAVPLKWLPAHTCCWTSLPTRSWHAKDMDMPVEPASLTKLMTAYLRLRRVAIQKTRLEADLAGQ